MQVVHLALAGYIIYTGDKTKWRNTCRHWGAPVQKLAIIRALDAAEQKCSCWEEEEVAGDRTLAAGFIQRQQSAEPATRAG